MFQRIQVTHTRLTVNDLLEKTYIPTFQRLDDKEHTDRITEGLYQYYNTHGELALIGSISLADLQKEKMILLDGQHRVRSLGALTERIPELRWNVIRVDIYTVSSEDEARQIYQIINSSKKVELYTGDVTPYIIPYIQRYFRDRYPEYCKTSRKPIGLNINLEILAKHLIGKKLIEKLALGVDSGEAIVERIKQLNQFYSDQAPERFIEWGVKDYDKRYKDLMETDNPFFLGLYRNYEWIDRILDPRPFEEQVHKAIVYKRRDIPKMIRRKVWEKRYGDQIEGQCYCCGNTIRLDEFHAAHRISAYDGGSNEIENLEATCSQCNIEMGTMNLDEYKKLFH